MPNDHIDHGKKIAAYYFWVFPNLMLNFYPWGLSLNKVIPLSQNKSLHRQSPANCKVLLLVDSHDKHVYVVLLLYYDINKIYFN